MSARLKETKIETQRQMTGTKVELYPKARPEMMFVAAD